MVEKVNCTNPNCGALILPTTANRTGGLCMTCVQNESKKQQAEFIRENRVTVNPFDGVVDPVETLLLMHKPPISDPLIETLKYPETATQFCSHLNSLDAARVIARVVTMVERGYIEEACDIAAALRRATSYDITRFLEALLEAWHFAPAFLFLEAADHIRDELIAHVDKSPHEVLRALAWIRDDRTVEQFAIWKRSAPALWHNLSIDEYTAYAGWELQEDGSRKDLCSQVCLPFVPLAEDSNAPPAVFLDAGGTCPQCRRPLVYLIDVDTQGTDIQLRGKRSPRLQVLTCEFCPAVGSIVFARLDSPVPILHSFHPILADVPNWILSSEPMPRGKLRLDRARRSPYYSCDDPFASGTSQLGGFPAWIQRPEYPNCPECGSTMMLIAQINGDDIAHFSDYIYYAFLCSNCSITATAAQGT